LIKDGPGGYNFWACSDWNKCGAKFTDADGHPGEKSNKSIVTSHVCPECGKFLRHIVKDGPDGYNFWACSDRNCSTTFQDNDGQPGQQNAKREKPPLSEFKCQSCKSPLIHRQGHSPKTDEDYDFFVCSNNNCKATYNSNGESPIFRSSY
jgi:DNA topoisomerase-1